MSFSASLTASRQADPFASIGVTKKNVLLAAAKQWQRSLQYDDMAGETFYKALLEAFSLTPDTSLRAPHPYTMLYHGMKHAAAADTRGAERKLAGAFHGLAHAFGRIEAVKEAALGVAHDSIQLG